MSDDLMTLEEVAQTTRMSVKFLRRETTRGALCTVRLGRSVRVRPEDLNAYISAHVGQSQNTEDIDA